MIHMCMPDIAFLPLILCLHLAQQLSALLQQVVLDYTPWVYNPVW